MIMIHSGDYSEGYYVLYRYDRDMKTAVKLELINSHDDCLGFITLEM